MMPERPSERDLLRTDLERFDDLVRDRPELLAPLADTSDLPRHSFHLVLADLVWQLLYHAKAGSLLLAHELEPSLHVIERAIFETLVGIGYLLTHKHRDDEAVTFLAYTHLRDQQEFPGQSDVFADRAAVLTRMPAAAVAEAARRLATHPYSWSGRSIKRMAEEGHVSGYPTLYRFLSGPAHAGVVGRYVMVLDHPDGKRSVQTGITFTDLQADLHANFIRRNLHSAFRGFINTLPGPVVQFPTWDPETWFPPTTASDE